LIFPSLRIDAGRPFGVWSGFGATIISCCPSGVAQNTFTAATGWSIWIASASSSEQVHAYFVCWIASTRGASAGGVHAGSTT
jgi:hypothetical protein